MDIYMQNTIHELTEYLFRIIAPTRAFYSLEELHKTTTPSFLVERIRITIEENVLKELDTTSNVWFNNSLYSVQKAWQDYQQAAIEAAHIPKDNFHKILSHIVTDIVHILIEPRKNLANYIFEDDYNLDFKEIEYRCKKLTVYKHFGTAIPLYIKKRKLDTLDKERCDRLIQEFDEKLVAKYKPKDWAQTLDPLFEMFNGKVDSKLITRFFDDKELSEIANKFSSKEASITRSDLVLILSEMDEIKVSNTKLEEKNMDESLFDLYATDTNPLIVVEDFSENESQDGSKNIEGMSDEFHEDQKKDKLAVSQEKKAPLNEIVQRKKEHQNDSLLQKREELNAENESDQEKNISHITHTPHQEQPIWTQYLSSDKVDVPMREMYAEEQISNHIQDEKAAEIEVNDDFTDLLFEENETPSHKKIHILSKITEVLNDRKFEFIEVIFKTSEPNYQRALLNLSTLKNWEEASDYINNEIFTKNNVDLLSEITVDFTDRMQHFFNSYS